MYNAVKGKICEPKSASELLIAPTKMKFEVKSSTANEVGLEVQS